jgi:hypothetical protein
MKNVGKIVALTAVALGISLTAANAQCHTTRNTLIGAGAGSVVLGAVTHSPAGWIGGAVLGGFAGHTISSNNCHDYYRHHYRHGYYDRYHHWHRYS